MKRHAFICCFGVTLLLGVGFISCRAQKNLQRAEETTSRIERVERTMDTTRVVEVDEQRTNRSGSEVDQSYSRITEYNRDGGIQSVSETWRDRRSADVVVQERHSQSVSLTGASKEVVESDSSSTVINEVVSVDTDSRPVQGIEWLWLAMGVAILLVIIGLIVFRKLKQRKSLFKFSAQNLNKT